ncbi:HD domain-containing protein [Candidatus Acetothermia bacterium]|nr:HD domain-containing protein [Candidatus Acetothermia bacterium]
MINEKISKSKTKHRFLILFVLVGISILLTYYFGLLRSEPIPYSHFFYIPLILTAIWYAKKAVYLAIFFIVIYFLATYFSPQPITIAHFVRSISFVVVPSVVGWISTKRIRAEKYLKIKVEQLSDLAQISQTFSVTLDFNQVLSQINTLVKETTRSDYTSIMLKDESSHKFWSTEKLLSLPPIENRIRKEGFTKWILQSDQGVIIDEIYADGTVSPAPHEGAPRIANPEIVKAGLKSFAILPLKSKGHTLGLLYLYSFHPYTFHDQLLFLTTVAAQTAVAVENLQLYEQAQQEITMRKQAEETLQRSFIQLAETTSRAMEIQDPYTAGHQYQVAALARRVGEKIGFDQKRLLGLYLAGLLHDIGKISIPTEILTHPGTLNEPEWALIRSHPQRGYEILANAEFPWPIAGIILHHHERLDGSGYPNGLKGDDLSLEVRIIAVCDVVDAMFSDRPYRPARSIEEVLDELHVGKGVKYDSQVVDILLDLIEAGEYPE